MNEFVPCLCWLEFYTKYKAHTDAVLNAGFKGLRIFFNLTDLPYVPIQNINQSYINHCFTTMPCPYHAWTYEDNPSPNITGEPMKVAFDFCLKNNWLPIVCMGTQEEEPHNFLGRAINKDYWNWLEKFVKEFSIYLRTNYRFSRADFEFYNEPTKVQEFGFGWDDYAELGTRLNYAWKSVSSNRCHIFADDILWQYYLDEILKYSNFCKSTDYISAHIGITREDEEWDNGYIQTTLDKISRYSHLKLVLTELSVNGIWNRWDSLPDQIAMYGILGAIRCYDMGTATRIDDLWLWKHDGSIEPSSQLKIDSITEYNNINFKTWEIGDSCMRLEDLYYQNRPVDKIKVDKAGYGIMLIRKVLGLSHSNIFDTALTNAVKSYQALHALLPVDGKVGSATFAELRLESNYSKSFTDVHTLWSQDKLA